MGDPADDNQSGGLAGLWRWLTSRRKSPTTCYTVHGFDGCGWCDVACDVAQTLARVEKGRVAVTCRSVPRDEWGKVLAELRPQLSAAAAYHRSSPLVVEGCAGRPLRFVGGFTDFYAEVRKRYPQHAHHFKY